MKMNRQTGRRFLGKTDGFESKEERRYYQRMLRAYLKGQDYFAYGGHPVMREVLQFRFVR